MNYNIKELDSQEDYKLLETHLIERLPHKVASWNSKDNFNLRLAIPTKRALDSSLWIEYNQSWVNTLIIDVDRNISMEQAINECLAFEFEPTWICKTDKGVHIAFALENMVKYEWDRAIALARHIKQVLTTLLKADDKGSHRLKGIWRNPLQHDFYFSGLLYSLDNFKYLLDKEYAKSCTIQQKLTSSNIIKK